MQASEERFRAITESANDAIISADSAGNIVSWNTRAEAIFGYKAAEILGTPLTRLIPARYQTAHRQRFAHWAATGASRLVGTTVEFSGLRKDGREFPLELSLSTWSTVHGHYVTGLVRDLTAQKQLQETTRQQELQLIQANKMTALGTLVSGVAHEINNPTQVMLMHTRVIANAWDDAVDILDAQAQDSGTWSLGGLPYAEMRDTIPTLLPPTLSIIESQIFRPPQEAPTALQVNDAVQRALRLLAHLIKKHTDRLHVDLARHPSVRGRATCGTNRRKSIDNAWRRCPTAMWGHRGHRLRRHRAPGRDRGARRRVGIAPEHSGTCAIRFSPPSSQCRPRLAFPCPFARGPTHLYI